MRKWIDLFLFYSTIIIIISGIVLYIMPHGRVAYFTGWSFLGLNKDEWDNLHIIFGIVMVIFSIWHIVLNWKPLKKFLFKKEAVFAFIVVLIISIGSIKQIIPFKYVSDFQEYVKSLWPENKFDVPIPHGELLRLDEFCKKLGIDVNIALNKLKKEGIQATKSQTLKEIAINNNTTPAHIYEIIKQNSTQLLFIGSGIGRMSLEEFCKKYNVSLNSAIKKLEKQGFVVRKDETLREIAQKYSLTPLQVAQIIMN